MKEKFYCIMENTNSYNNELHIFEVHEKSGDVTSRSLCNHIDYSNCKKATNTEWVYDKQNLIQFCAEKENQMCGNCMKVLYGDNNQ